MSKTTKKITIIGLLISIVSIIFVAVLFKGHPGIEAVTVRPDNYYTWGWSNDELDIVEGQIITEVTFNLQGISHQTDNPDAILEFYLIDNPPDENGQQWVSNMGNTGIGDSTNVPRRSSPPWEPSLLFTYQDNTPGYENVSFKLSDTDILDHWIWDVYKRPLNLTLSGGDPNTVTFTSTLLEFIDYAGTGNAVGLLIDPGGEGYFQIGNMEMIVTIETFAGTYVKTVQTVIINFGNKAPVIL